MKRKPEPELMDSEAQTIAYAEADFNESNSLFVSRFLDNFPRLPKSGRMADLGCGPGDITVRMAHAFRGWDVTRPGPWSPARSSPPTAAWSGGTAEWPGTPSGSGGAWESRWESRST